MKGYEPAPQRPPNASGTTKFAPAGYKDVPFTVLFFITMIGVGVLTAAGWNDSVFVKDGHHGTPSGNSTDEHNKDGVELHVPAAKFAGVLVAVICSGVAVSGFWLVVLRAFPTQMIWASLLSLVAYWVLIAAVGVALKIYVLAVVGLVMAAIIGAGVFFIRHKIPFSAAMLETTISVVMMFPASIGLSFASIVVMAVVGVYFSLAAGVVVGVEDDNVRYGLAVFTLFAWFWAQTVVKNVLHVTCSGMYATWYFCMNAMPANPTMSALKRALTTSFGSICLGSLIIAIVKTMRAILNSMRRNRNALVAAVAACLLHCLEDIIRFFNIYAFTQVAIYGKSYCDAAKDTWRLFMDRGIDLIINDSVINLCLGITAFLAGLLNAAAGFALGYVVFGAKDGDSLTWTIVVAVIAFMLGVFICITVFESVSSGVACLFVCFAEAPEVMRDNLPALHQTINSKYGDRVRLL